MKTDSEAAIVATLQDLSASVRDLNAAFSRTSQEMTGIAATLKSAVDQSDRHYNMLLDQEQRLRALEKESVDRAELEKVSAKLDRIHDASMTVGVKQKLVYGAVGAVGVALMGAVFAWAFTTRTAPPAAPPAAPSTAPAPK